MFVRELAQFRVCPVLDGMRDKDIGRIDAKRFRLHIRRVDELRGGDADSGNAALFEVRDVMRTARRAAASIGQAFDHQVDFRADLLRQRHGCRARDRRFHVAFDFDALLGQ